MAEILNDLAVLTSRERAYRSSSLERVRCMDVSAQSTIWQQNELLSDADKEFTPTKGDMSKLLTVLCSKLINGPFILRFSEYDTVPHRPWDLPRAR